MRLIHTADWHLGHSLHGISREYEQKRFLDWLLEQLESRAIDALLLAGDVFDSANPPATAQALFFQFLSTARRRCPHLDIVIIAGNHDSPSRLEAPAPVLRALGVHVIGALRQPFAPADLLVPLHDCHGETAAWCVAVPFLRPADLPREREENAENNSDPLIAGVRRVYADVLAAARPHQTIVAAGHCYLTGTCLSELSERKILSGNQHALPVDIFSEDIAYTALGHLHLAQKVGGRDTVRYSGSPIPLSLDEAGYPHQVLEVELAAGQAVAMTPLRVPRSVDMLRLPPGEPAPLAEVLAHLQTLALPEQPREQQPFVEVRVRLEQPEPALRSRVEEALLNKPVRLLKITPFYLRNETAPPLPERGLCEIDPEEVFRSRYRRDFPEEPPAALLAAFQHLVDEVYGE